MNNIFLELHIYVYIIYLYKNLCKNLAASFDNFLGLNSLRVIFSNALDYLNDKLSNLALQKAF